MFENRIVAIQTMEVSAIQQQALGVAVVMFSMLNDLSAPRNCAIPDRFDL